jgi:hypothetical protein
MLTQACFRPALIATLVLAVARSRFREVRNQREPVS